MHIHLLRVSSESETMRKFVMCIASPLKSKRIKWQSKFCTNFRNLLLYSRSFNNFSKLSFSDVSFNTFCHSLMQVSIENILKTKGMLDGYFLQNRIIFNSVDKLSPVYHKLAKACPQSQKLFCFGENNRLILVQTG